MYYTDILIIHPPVPTPAAKLPSVDTRTQAQPGPMMVVSFVLPPLGVCAFRCMNFGLVVTVFEGGYWANQGIVVFFFSNHEAIING